MGLEIFALGRVCNTPHETFEKIGRFRLFCAVFRVKFFVRIFAILTNGEVVNWTVKRLKILGYLKSMTTILVKIGSNIRGSHLFLI